MNGRLSLDRVPMPEGRELPDVIICATKHRFSWQHLRRLMPAFRGPPNDRYPRGRVVYLKAGQKYDLYVGPGLMADVDSIQQIMTAMHRPRDQTEVRLAAQFRTRSVLMHLPAAHTEVQLAAQFRTQRFP
jgi:hypothetical protein